jgi:hypothetical protein
MTINRLNQGTTNQVLVKAISGQTTNLLELQDSSGNVVSSIGPTGALGGTVADPYAGSWTSYTPTLTNATLGNGTITAAYNKIGKTVVVRFKFVLGSTSTVGSFPNFSLPFNAVSIFADLPVGVGELNDSGNRWYGRTRIAGPTTYDVVFDSVSANKIQAGFVTATAPFTWATGDYFQGIFTYEAV